MTTPDLQQAISDGGVSLALPDGWRPARATEHAAVFVADTDVAGVVPTAVLETHPGHLAPADWWVDQATVLPGAMLLEVVDERGGFRARWAHLADGRSVTTHLRARHVPGRTVLVTVVHATGADPATAALAGAILGSLAVAGLLPPGGQG